MNEKFGFSFTASGLAAMWLRGHAPLAEEKDIQSLATLLLGTFADGKKSGLERGVEVTASSPTLGAAHATLEADVVDIKKLVVPKNDELDFDLTEFAKSSLDPLML